MPSRRSVTEANANGTHPAYPHLHYSAGEMVSMGDQERLAFFRKDRWIPYARANQIVHDLEDIIQRDQVTRMPCRIVIGPSNNGKTQLGLNVKRRNMAYVDEESHRPIVPVAFIPALEGPNVAEFWSELLNALGIANNPEAPVRRNKSRALKFLEELKTRLIIIDEFNNAVNGPPNKQREFLGAVRYTAVRARIPIACFGTKQIRSVMQLDSSFSNRFKALPLDAWSWDKDWQRLLIQLEAMIPLPKRSKLAEAKFAKSMHNATDGCIGELVELLQCMFAYALKEGEQALNVAMIRDSGWLPPRERAG